MFPRGNLLVTVVLCAWPLLQTSSDVIDTLTRQGSSLLSLAKDGNETIRQCSCTEQHECVTKMEAEGLDCVDQCWTKLNTLTKTPADLKKCFSHSRDLIESFVTCFERDGNSYVCPIVKIIETSVEFAHCVKACFIGKNSNGFCFDEKSCQPMLTSPQTRKTLRQCSRLIDFKKEAGELCDCSVKAGLSDLEKYCPMLKLIGGRGNQRGSGGGGTNKHHHGDAD